MPNEVKPRKVVEKPRISVNKLAEYLEANPERRKRIVFDAKHPAEFVTTRYKEAREIIKDYIMGKADEDMVLSKIDDFSDADAASEWQEQDNNLSAEALEQLLDTDIECWEDFEIKPFDGDNTLLEISGVGISVYPDLITRFDAGDFVEVGLIKLHMSKTNELSEESQKIVGVLLYEFTDRFVANKGGGEMAAPHCCISFDVFRQRSEYCPTAVKMRLRKIEAACEEIALWWEKL